jgi:hypothetical protein
MNRQFNLVLLPILLAAAGCASKASLEAAYDASLQRWQGATRADLEAQWGKPMLVQPGAEGPMLTWVTRNDSLQDRPGATGAPSTGGQGMPVPGAISAASVPITCSTHFALKDGRVASWTFEGLGCGAPY